MSYWTTPAGSILMIVGQSLLVILLLLLSTAFLIFADRKIFAAVGMRRGPNVVGPYGLLQSFADLLKFLLKELVLPSATSRPIFLLAPLIGVVLAIGAWAVIPFGPDWVVSNLNVGVLYILAISSLGALSIVVGGWASNSKYAFLGSLRSAAQMVSYEISMGFVIVAVLLMSGTMNLQTIVAHQAGGFWHWNVLGGGGVDHLPLAAVMIPMAVIFFVSSLAETNRPPFDLPEAESELVAGFMVEYSSSAYMLFYLAETVNIVLMCGLNAILFFGGWQAPFPTSFLNNWTPLYANLFGFLWFATKILFFFFMFALVRAVVPRYRYDQLMRLCWKIFLPTSLVAVVLVSAWRVYGPAT